MILQRRRQTRRRGLLPESRVDYWRRKTMSANTRAALCQKDTLTYRCATMPLRYAGYTHELQRAYAQKKVPVCRVHFRQCRRAARTHFAAGHRPHDSFFLRPIIIRHDDGRWLLGASRRRLAFSAMPAEHTRRVVEQASAAAHSYFRARYFSRFLETAGNRTCRKMYCNCTPEHEPNFISLIHSQCRRAR